MGAVWVPAKVVQELFRHSTISMTIDIYARMHPSVQREVMDKTAVGIDCCLVCYQWSVANAKRVVRSEMRSRLRGFKR